MRISINRCALSIALAFAGASAQAADWTVKELGTFGRTYSGPNGVNASGRVVGYRFY